MSLQVVIEANALNQAAGFLADDPDGLRKVLQAIDDLVTEPRPADSFPFGSPDLRRLRVDRYRVLYRIQEDVISVGHISRTTRT